MAYINGKEILFSAKVGAGNGTNLQIKKVSENGVVLPDAGYDGLSKVIVLVKAAAQDGISTDAETQKCEIRNGVSTIGNITTTATVVAE